MPKAGRYWLRGLFLIASLTASTAACGGGGGTTGARFELSQTLPGIEDIRRGFPQEMDPQHIRITRATDTPQGRLTEAQVRALLDRVAYQQAFQSAGGGAGAHASFDVESPREHVDVLAIAFATGKDARRFHDEATRMLTTAGQGTIMEINFGPPPKEPVVKVPSAPLGDQFVTDLVYPDGVYYRVSVTVPSGSVATVLAAALAQRQDSEYGLCTSHPRSCGPAAHP